MSKASDHVAERLAAEGLALEGPELVAAIAWYEVFVACRPMVEALISPQDEPAVGFDAGLGVAR